MAFNVIHTCLPSAHVHMVSDINSIAACNFPSLPDWVSARHCYDTPPKATVHQAIELAQLARGAAALLAVGSGTINDLCKYAAHLLHVPYAVVATAPSMNGYVSPNASLIMGQHKQSVEASAPVAVFYDDNVLSHAPPRLVHAGIGDTLCYSTVKADLMLAHHLINAEPYDTLRHAMEKDEAQLHYALKEGGDVTLALMQALLSSGRAMAIAQSSAPASQGEHMIAHYLEMISPDISHYYHGEIIAVTTMMMAKLWQKAQEMTGQLIKRKMFPFAALENRFGQAQTHQWQKAYEEKWSYILPSATFPDMSEYIPDVAMLEHFLTQAGCPIVPSDIGIDDNMMNEAVTYAAFTRNRFTLLDVI